MIGLLVGLAGASVVLVGAYTDGADLEAGADRFTTALRMARAEAAHAGRRIRLAFDAEDGRAVVLWEAEPLAEPGVFTEYVGAPWTADVPTDLVRVVRSELTGPSAYELTAAEARDGGDPGEPLDAITFYPDGSCDSAVIELRAVDAAEDDGRCVVAEMNGLTGVVRRHEFNTAEARDEFYDQLAARREEEAEDAWADE